MLLDSSASYVEAKVAFRHALLAAQRSGMDDADIARATGGTVEMVEALAGKRR